MISRRKFIHLGALGAAGALFADMSLVHAQGTSTLDRIRTTKTLRIGAVRGGTPYYYYDVVHNRWEGCMIDMASDLAAKLGAQLAITETTWGNAVLDLQSSKIDVFFGLAPTPQRQRVVNFSTPLFNNAISLVARNGFSVKDWSELNVKGTRIAVDLGSTYDEMVTRTCPNATIMRFDQTNDATLAVQAGRADCQVTVIVLGLTMLKKNPAIGHLIVPLPVQASATCAVLPKESTTAWLDYFDAWLAQLRQSGKVSSIMSSNLEHLVGLKPGDIPPQVRF